MTVVLDGAVQCSLPIIRMFLDGITMMNNFCGWDILASVRKLTEQRLGGLWAYKIIPV